MRKAILVSLIVALLAITGIGAAYATGMNFSGVGYLSQGTATIPQVNVTSVSYNLDDYGSVTGVVLKFDKALAIGAEICVDLQDSTVTAPGSVITAKATLGAALPAGEAVTIAISPPNNQITRVDRVQVVVAE